MMLPIGYLYSNNINNEVLRELSFLKYSKEDQVQVKENKIEEHPKKEEDKNFKKKEKIFQVLILYNVKEYNAALFLLLQNKKKDDLTIDKLRVLIKISNKLSKDESVSTELKYLSSFRFLEFFYINEAYKQLILNDNMEDLMEFLENIKVSLDKPFDDLNFSEEEKKILKLTKYYKNENEKEKREVLLATVYEKNDLLLESYEIYKKWNNQKYKSKLVEMRTKIKSRIAIYSKKTQKVKKMKKASKDYKNLEIFKVIKVR